MRQGKPQSDAPKAEKPVRKAALTFEDIKQQLAAWAENERIPGKREEERYDTDDRKLEFLQRYGWLMDDEEVRAYSAKFKPKK